MDFQEHYKNHLSKFYSWMFGDFDKAVQYQKELLLNYGIKASKNSVAIDLGCGPGFQSIALEELGYNVHAVDLSKELLEELDERKTSIKTREADIRDLDFAKSLNPDVIVCMGDTLTHLSQLEDIEKLIKDSFHTLNQNGTLLFSYRDLSHPVFDTNRFFVVQSDETKILTCFLEDFPEKVRVTDLLHVKEGEKWSLTKSSYHKLKIPLEFLERSLESSGFKVSTNKLPSGMLVIQGVKL